MPQTRQLAAIMFTDIVGYTGLMEKDEQRAFEILKKNREIHQPIINKYNGKLIKELGDGILASFPTVSDALCVSSEAAFVMRVGLSVGEVEQPSPSNWLYAALL